MLWHHSWMAREVVQPQHLENILNLTGDGPESPAVAGLDLSRGLD